MSKINIGLIGEYYLMFELAKRGINVFKMSNFLNFDLLLKNGLRVEVKTSTIRTEYSKINKIPREYYMFKLKKNQVECDFFVFVCLNKKKNVDKIFIVPQEVIKERDVVSIPKKFKHTSYNGFTLKDYENKWDLITKICP
jgi:hypothetical protein